MAGDKKVKVILTKPLPGQGPSGQVIEVADAYARNFLLPRGLAQAATPTIIAAAASRQHRQSQGLAKKAKDRRDAQARLAGQTITIKAPANKQGRLFAGLKAQDILRAMTASTQLLLADVRTEPDHIKSVGQHQLEIIWSDGGRATVTVIVESQQKKP